MDVSKKRRLAAAAARIRMKVIEGTFHAKSGHPGGSLSVADTLAYLYFSELNVDPARPRWEGRDPVCPLEGALRARALRCAGAPGLFPRGRGKEAPEGRRGCSRGIPI